MNSFWKSEMKFKNIARKAEIGVISLIRDLHNVLEEKKKEKHTHTYYYMLFHHQIVAERCERYRGTGNCVYFPIQSNNLVLKLKVSSE